MSRPPYADEQGEYGEKLNNLTKFVVSSTLDDAPWGDFPAATVTRDPIATIGELKAQSGQDIWLWGTVTLMHSLLGAGVVDEVRLLVCPASRGTGTRVFADRHDLKVLEATSFDNGLALLRYEIRKWAGGPLARVRAWRGGVRPDAVLRGCAVLSARAARLFGPASRCSG